MNIGGVENEGKWRGSTRVGVVGSHMAEVTSVTFVLIFI
jgi:hypothetical protein